MNRLGADRAAGPGAQVKSWWVLAGLAGIAVLVFGGVLQSTWTYDDFPVVVFNPDIRSWSAFVQDSYPGRPLRELTYLLDQALFGLDRPGLWHLQNLCWHVLAAFALWLLARELGLGGVGGSIAALLFLLHPLQVEVVANVSHRKDSLLGCFALLATWGVVRGCKESGGLRRGWLVAAGCGWLAWLAKEPAVMLPAVWLGVWWLSAPSGEAAKRLLRRWLAVVAVAALLALLVWLLAFAGAERYAHEMAGLLQRRTGFAGDITFPLYLLTVLKSWGFMGLRLFWPASLAIEYHLPVAESWCDPYVVLALALLGSAGLVAVRCWRRAPVAAFGLLWAGLLWLPLANLYPLVYLAADRYLYVPLAGLALVAGWGGERLLAVAGRRVPGAVLLLAGLVLAACSWQQTRVWHDNFTLWNHAVEVSPQSSYALNNLGSWYLEQGERATAERLFERATANPFNPHPHDNLGWLLEKRGDWAGAVTHYQAFIRLADQDPLSRKRVDFLVRYLAERGVSIPR